MRADEGDVRVRVGLSISISAKLELCARAHTHTHTAAGGVGLLLGAVRAQDVRPLCESWAVWADNRLSGIAAAWKAAVAAPP